MKPWRSDIPMTPTYLHTVTMPTAMPRQLLLWVLVISMSLSVTEGLPKFPQTAGEICDYLKRIASQCPIPTNITGMNAPLFRDAKLRPVLEQCRVNPSTVPAATSTISDFKKWRMDFLTYVVFSSRCGLLIEPEDIEDEEVIDVANTFLEWTPGIAGSNCALIRKFLTYIDDNLPRFLVPLYKFTSTIRTVHTDVLKYSFSMLPKGLCALAEHGRFFTKEQVSGFVDVMVADCDSGTILGNMATCSWKDKLNVYIKAITVSSATRSAPDVCLAAGAGEHCVSDGRCIQTLCKLDIKLRNCSSPCTKVLDNAKCRQPRTISTNSQCTRSLREANEVELPDPATATAADFSDVVCCLLRRGEDQSRYSPEILCRLTPDNIVDSRCQTKFAEWQISYAPRCDNCTGSPHTTALLSPDCLQTAVKLVETTVDDVKSLIRGTKGRKMLYKLFHDIYRNMDMELRDFVCTTDFLAVLTVEDVKSIGPSNLQPVLMEMIKCDEPPPIAKVLAILVAGNTCPTSMLINSGTNLILLGAMTDHCYETLQSHEALQVCSIIMTKTTHRIPKRKIKLLCKIIDQLPGDTTCILCPLKKKRVFPQTELTVVVPRPHVQATRCLYILNVPERWRTPDQLWELQRCKPCKTDQGNLVGSISWCHVSDVSFEQLKATASTFCTLPCDELKCFLDQTIRLVRLAIKRNETIDPYSNMQYVRPFLPTGIRHKITPLWRKDRGFGCTSRCPVVVKQRKEYILQGSQKRTRRRRETKCNTMQIIEEFDNDGGSLSSVLEPEELRCLESNEVMEVVISYSLGLEDWKPEQAKILLEKVLTSLGMNSAVELTEDQLRNLGLILIASKPSELKEIKYINNTLLGILGSSARWSTAQMNALLMRYLEQEGRTPSQLRLEDIFLLQNLIAGFTAKEIKEIPSAAIKGASAVLGAIPLCQQELVEALINHLILAHGKVQTWDESQLAEYSNLLGGLDPVKLNAVGPSVVSYMTDTVWLYHMDADKFNELSDQINETVTDYQRNLALQKSPECDGIVVEKPQLDAGRPKETSSTSLQRMGFHTIFACFVLLGVVLK